MSTCQPASRRSMGPGLIALAVVVLLSLPAFAAWALPTDKAFHQFVMRAWSIEEGLPQISVNAVVQDSAGYIWTGTQAGVSRFDGVRFVTFDPSNTPEVPGSLVEALFVDLDGHLWVGTYRGAVRYRDGGFTPVPDAQGRDPHIFGFSDTAEGVILAATDHGLLRFDGSELIRLPDDPAGTITALRRHGDRVLAGGTGEVHLLDEDGWRSLVFDGDLAQAGIRDLIWHHQGYWVASDQGLMRISEDWRDFELVELPVAGELHALHADGNGNLWIGGSGGLFRFVDDQFLEFTAADDLPGFSAILSMTSDHEGNLWLGSQLDGLFRIWDSWTFRYAGHEGLHHDLLWSVAIDEAGAVWTGTMDGLSVFRDGRFERITTGDEQPHPHAYTLLVEPDRVWVGTRAGLFWWDRQGLEIVVPDEFRLLDGVQVNGIIQRLDGSYWLATMDGVWRWDGRELVRLAERDQPGGRDVRILLETSDGRLLAGAIAGLFQYDEEHAVFFRPTGAPAGQDVTALAELSNGWLVAGTLEERLWFQTDDGWLEFGTEHGLPVNSAFAFGEHDGTLWIGGLRGLQELPLETIEDWRAGRVSSLPGQMVINERGDIPGAQKGHCCTGAGNAKGEMVNGEFWLPSRSGLVRLVPGRVSRNPLPPPLVIDRVRIDNQWHQVTTGANLVLESDQRNVAFGVAALSYQDPQSVQIEYRLSGLDDEWQRLDEPMQRQIVYTNLPAGNLELQVRATNQAGVWTDQPATLPVRVQPRFHETLLFRLGIMALLLALVWLAVSLRVRNLRWQRAQLEHVVAERTEQLRVANEHLREYSRRMETASMTDPLTGLWNRRYLIKQLPADLALFMREREQAENSDAVVLFGLIDLDNFKEVNDYYGHAAGDQLLIQLADLLRGLVRDADYVIRWGGEEFLIVFRKVGRGEVEHIAQRLVDAIADHRFEPRDGEIVDLSCSVGLAEYPVMGDSIGANDWEDAVALADKALYRIKRSGKNGWGLLRTTDRLLPGQLRKELERSLDDLLAERRLTLAQGSAGSAD